MTSHLELEEGDFRHRDVEGEGFVPARVEPVVLDRLRCRLWIPREILVVTSDNHLESVHYETYIEHTSTVSRF